MRVASGMCGDVSGSREGVREHWAGRRQRLSGFRGGRPPILACGARAPGPGGQGRWWLPQPAWVDGSSTLGAQATHCDCMDLQSALLPTGPNASNSNTSDGSDNLTSPGMEPTALTRTTSPVPFIFILRQSLPKSLSYPGWVCTCNSPASTSWSTGITGSPPRTGSVSYINIIMPSVFGTICLLGIVGNSTVIFAVVKKSKLHWCSNVPDIFIINLSVVDLLFLLGMPFMIHQLMGNGVWHFGETMCTLITAMDANSQFTSTYILTAMAIDRYLATVHPISSTKFRKPSVATLVIGLLWALSFISITPVWLYARLIPFPGGTVGCGIRLPNPDTDLYWFTLYQFFLAFALPFVVITAAYVRILQRMTTSVAPASQRSIRLRTKRVTRTAIAICLVFFVCWAPYYVLQLTQLSISRPTLTFVYLYNAAISLGYANSCLNPFVYIVLCETFRKRLVLSVKPAAQGQLRTVSNAATADEERTESKGT
ncbi:melanin-concentrating hormone receptor 1 isoform X2 [Cavia porcellus]|uniref:melanin-concentrating hormone receptor 1 isoform X2 n=1 Tax=Cavia porcellus TaxID=10141 RepID=UPI002FE0FDE0